MEGPWVLLTQGGAPSHLDVCTQVTHWHSPYFFAYFPTANSYPALLADILCGAIGCIGFSWVSSAGGILGDSGKGGTCCCGDRAPGPTGPEQVAVAPARTERVSALE